MGLRPKPPPPSAVRAPRASAESRKGGISAAFNLFGALEHGYRTHATFSKSALVGMCREGELIRQHSEHDTRWDRVPDPVSLSGNESAPEAGVVIAREGERAPCKLPLG
jgi:hypothetical protein